MKSASLPALRVTPEFRAEAESVLEEGETLSSLLEEAVLAEIQLRRSRREFIERGLSSRDRARETGVYYSAEDVLERLDERLKLHEDRA
ncbi:prevent-host-death protein [Microvenator marinus]|uniref:Prevent-host-death protein n=1 Tax=Microvenator marinus TaxID=2600177 RepID=A0A5B8XZ85_9DELT|nr:YlcI/YnfO family protein [Microvenator marinus]QED29293.1 prevent-host-death protein [Microvenator marinus]